MCEDPGQAAYTRSQGRTHTPVPPEPRKGRTEIPRYGEKYLGRYLGRNLTAVDSAVDLFLGDQYLKLGDRYYENKQQIHSKIHGGQNAPFFSLAGHIHGGVRKNPRRNPRAHEK